MTGGMKLCDDNGMEHCEKSVKESCDEKGHGRL